MQLWSNNDLNESLRTANVRFLISKVYELGIPSNWHVTISSRSVYVANPKRTFEVKVDDAGIFTMDVRRKGNVKSSKFNMTSVEKAWPMAEQAIKTNMKMAQNEQNQKEQNQKEQLVL